MKTKEEIKEYLLKNAVDERGDLNLSELDFSDFDGDIFINKLKVKKNLFQNLQQVGLNIMQNHQESGLHIFQHDHKFKGNIFSGKTKRKKLTEEDCTVRIISDSDLEL